MYGATYMLSKPDATPVFEDGKAVGVSSEGQTARAKLVVGDPSYFPDRVERAGRVVRAMCILSHPIPGTADSHSVQIILPQKQVGGSCMRLRLSHSRNADMIPSGLDDHHPAAEAGTVIADRICLIVVNFPVSIPAGMVILLPQKCGCSRAWSRRLHFVLKF